MPRTADPCSGQGFPADHHIPSLVRTGPFVQGRRCVYRKCRAVNLKGWTSRHGSYLNNQTGSPLTTFPAGFNGKGAILRRDVPWAGVGSDFGLDNDFNFYPVNSIRVC